MIREPMNRVRTYATIAFGSVAALFLLAVCALEVFAKFFKDNEYIIGLYVVVLPAIGLIVIVAAHNHWQSRAEDYRAVSEMLRVQRVWWAAGLTERVDRVHLQGVDMDLGRIRDAVRAILNWVWLRSPWPFPMPTDEDRALVHACNSAASGMPRPTIELARLWLQKRSTLKDWIGGQIGYYAARGHGREKTASRCNCVTWTLIVSSWWLAVLVLGWLIAPEVKAMSHGVLHQTQFHHDPGAVSVPFLAGALAIVIGRVYIYEGRVLLFSRFLTIGFGFLAACGFGVGIVALGSTVSNLVHLDEDGSIKGMAVVGFVLLTAIAGAVRFVSEKLGFEAEALAYRDALDKFVRAERRLATAGGVANCNALPMKEYQSLILELGKLALSENEEWLKAHRERPLGPVI